MAHGGFLKTPPTFRIRTTVLTLLASALLTSAGCVPAAVRGPTSIWIVNETREITPDSEPFLENEVYSATRRQARFVSAVNDTTAFQLALRTDLRTVGPFDVSLSDLTGPSGVLHADAAVSIYRAHGVRVEKFRSWYPSLRGRSATPAEFLDVLVPWEAPRGGGPLRLAARQTELVWIDIHVPSATEPGVYVGRLTVTAGRNAPPVFMSTIELTVVPVAIPSEPATAVLCRVDPSDLLAAHLNWPSSPVEEIRIDANSPDRQAAKRLIDNTMRLFQAHRATPLLWAAFPKYRLGADHAVEIDWTAYDNLVEGWLDGDAFENQVGLTHWHIPATMQYPNAERNGGFQSARYARLLSAYIAECRRHFEQRGWRNKSFLRLTPPGELSQPAVDRMRRTIGIVRQSETSLPFVAHLPAESLRSLGWHDAVAIEAPEVDIWAPYAQWFEPDILRREQDIGKQVWFMPGDPPYSVSLAPEAPAADARLLPWQGRRYGVDTIWIEHAAEFADQAAPDQADSREGLLYPGVRFGLADQPLPSIRLKRLRRGLLDCELLRLLELNGKPLLARRTTEQIVRRAFTEACEENLLSTRPPGWVGDARTLWLARRVLLQELVNEFAPSTAGRGRQVENLADWSMLMNQAARVHGRIRGARLKSPEQISVYVDVTNVTRRTLEVKWAFPALPMGWAAEAPSPALIAPGGRAVEVVDVMLDSLTYNADGAYPFQMLFETQAGPFSVNGRLAAAVCPMTTKTTRIDGDLSDWMLASNNVAGDFRLVRGGGPYGERTPTQPTQAFFCMDNDNLYFAIRCSQREDERPLWLADNRIPLDGAIPWGQDLVEILLDPHNLHQGTGEHIHAIQIKPSGLSVSRKGCLTDPPMNRSEVWQSGARVAVRHEPRSWIVEVAVPLDSFGPAARRNRVWGCNITRLDARRGEYSSWSGASEYAYLPQALGNLVLLRP